MAREPRINVYDAEDEEYEVFDDDDEPVDLGPDERDRDLLDGSWEEAYYAGRVRRRDWNSVGVAVALLALIGMLLPASSSFFADAGRHRS